MYKLIVTINGRESVVRTYKSIREARRKLKMNRNMYMREGKRVIIIGDCMYVTGENTNWKFVIKK